MNILKNPFFHFIEKVNKTKDIKKALNESLEITNGDKLEEANQSFISE